MSTPKKLFPLTVAALLTGALLVSGPGSPAIAAPDADAGPPSVSVDPSSGRVVADPTGVAFTEASGAAPADIVLGYIREHAGDFGLTAGAVAELYVHKELTLSTGATAVHVGQRVDGLRVRDAIMTGVVAADGRLVSVAGFLAPGDAAAATVNLTAQAALDVAADAQDAEASRPLDEADTKSEEPQEYPNVYAEGVTEPAPVTAEQVWYPDANGTALRRAWLTDIESSDLAWFETVVDAKTGEVIDQRSRYAHVAPEGDVFREQHPEATGAVQQTTSFSGIGGSWVDDRTTSGNNVNAYLDRNNDNANNEYQPQTPANGDPGYQEFSYPFTDAWRTTADVNSVAALDADRDAIITQLFYYTNVMHDWLYGHGFDEASGNFQVDNFGNGGSGGDAVLAEAQDGWDLGCINDQGTPAPGDDVPIRCLNNANFGTPGDGASPRMQMYMWAPGSPYRDGDMDGDVIAHEYGHGVSSRLVGGGTLGYNGGDQRGALGEGWSDVISYLKWGDAVIGEYVTGNAGTGIRSVAYDTSTRTFQSYDTNSGSGHGNGEIWASAVYDIRAQFPGGVEPMATLVLDAMKATPANPTFIDARNGLLTADGGANLCLIWSAFAGRGLGVDSTTGLDTVPTASAAIPPECAPTADAGGPYVTPEGTDAALTAAGSTSGSDASAGAITGYAWDLDNDGQYDDATGPTPSFTSVGQDGVYPIGVQITDAFGNTSTDTSTVTVTNVAPTVAIDAITPIDEFGTVNVSGTVTDPGWLDDLSATISFDDGAAAVALTGVEENVRPDATLTFSVQHQYGDNGDFSVKVCAADDDTVNNCDTEVAAVANVDPTATIDTSGEQAYDGVSAFILEAGQQLTVPASSTDPGSDDLTLTWAWGDTTSNSKTSLVNPPATDPAKSPSVQPRNVTLEASHVYGDACLYELGVTAADDDGGVSVTDTAAVVITGNASESKGHGWWLNQYRVKKANDFTAAELQCYLDIVGYFSLVFSEKKDASTRAAATLVLNNPAKAPADVIFDQHALGAWLNFANGSVSLSTPVDTDKNGTLDSTFGAVMFAAETVRVNPASTSAQIKAQKDIIERIATQSGP
ncbi:Zn-dependent metalloprotease [Microbacterium sp. cf046]|uniref:M36 family metallopeptidase n=1 Tax=Microbacterium sp. cf046 TaxID=1761803 RepID=UPI0008E40356|nr:M36 family metallopeptidase [Microbacterium sp. cf046]SFR92543.1 Zn-dependent metalloprotease [Microbacterium sp. cf046]